MIELNYFRLQQFITSFNIPLIHKQVLVHLCLTLNSIFQFSEYTIAPELYNNTQIR